MKCVWVCVGRRSLTRGAKASTEHRLRDVTKVFGTIREGEVGSSNWEAGSVQGVEVVEVPFEHDLHDLQNKTRRKKRVNPVIKRQTKEENSNEKKRRKRRKRNNKKRNLLQWMDLLDR